MIEEITTVPKFRLQEPIPLAVPEIRGNEWAYIKECLDTNWVSSAGPFVGYFEEAFARQIGTKYAVATVNGTAALHTALLVADVQPDDEVLVSTLTFIAPANAIRYVGAWPVFIDAEGDHWQMDPQRVADFLEQDCHWSNGELRNKASGGRVSAIIPVHILGHPVDMDPILEVARRYGLVVIEDASESLGAQYKRRNVGRLGDIACFSFNGNKIMTTGGGGMLVTDNEAWARRAEYLINQAKDDPLAYIHHTIGYNYRLTNLQAAMGCAQLEQLDEYVQTKRRIAAAYTHALQEIPGITPMQAAPYAYSAFWLYTILIDPRHYGIDNQTLLARLKQAGVQTRPLWQPIHCSPAHRGEGGQTPARACPTADRLHSHALSLPCSVGLTAEQFDRVVALIRNRGCG